MRNLMELIDVPDGRHSEATAKWQWLQLGLLLLVCCSVSFGVWHWEVPEGDESAFIARAATALETGNYPLNAYFLVYIFLLKLCGHSAVIAHLILRSLNLVSAVILMQMLFRNFEFLSRQAVLVVLLFWASCQMVVPFRQYGNINLFCFNLVLLGGVVLLRFPGLNGALFQLLLTLIAVRVRSEYAAVFAGSVGYYACQVWHRRD